MNLQKKDIEDFIKYMGNPMPVNDEFMRCMRGLAICDQEIVQKREEEIRGCNHLFVKLREAKYVHEMNSSDCIRIPEVVECVHCGLTNRFAIAEELDFELMIWGQIIRHSLVMLIRYRTRTIESRMFDEVFSNLYRRGGKSFDSSSLNLISEECLLTNNPGILYQLARKINPSGNNEELFEIMKQLRLLETEQEEIRLQTVEQATSLLDRYYTNKPKSLVLKK